MVKSREKLRECNVTGKQRYLTHAGAVDASLKARSTRPLEVFFCKSCLGWHVKRMRKGYKHALQRDSGETE